MDSNRNSESPSKPSEGDFVDGCWPVPHTVIVLPSLEGEENMACADGQEVTAQVSRVAEPNSHESSDYSHCTVSANLPLPQSDGATSHAATNETENAEEPRQDLGRDAVEVEEKVESISNFPANRDSEKRIRRRLVFAGLAISLGIKLLTRCFNK